MAQGLPLDADNGQRFLIRSIVEMSAFTTCPFLSAGVVHRGRCAPGLSCDNYMNKRLTTGYQHHVTQHQQNPKPRPWGPFSKQTNPIRLTFPSRYTLQRSDDVFILIIRLPSRCVGREVLSRRKAPPIRREHPSHAPLPHQRNLHLPPPTPRGPPYLVHVPSLHVVAAAKLAHDHFRRRLRPGP